MWRWFFNRFIILIQLLNYSTIIHYGLTIILTLSIILNCGRIQFSSDFEFSILNCLLSKNRHNIHANIQERTRQWVRPSKARTQQRFWSGLRRHTWDRGNCHRWRLWTCKFWFNIEIVLLLTMTLIFWIFIIFRKLLSWIHLQIRNYVLT